MQGHHKNRRKRQNKREPLNPYPWESCGICKRFQSSPRWAGQHLTAQMLGNRAGSLELESRETKELGSPSELWNTWNILMMSSCEALNSRIFWERKENTKNYYILLNFSYLSPWILPSFPFFPQPNGKGSSISKWLCGTWLLTRIKPQHRGWRKPQEGKVRADVITEK